MLEIGQYALVAAIVFTVLALASQILAYTAPKRASTSHPGAATSGTAARRSHHRQGLDWYVTAFSVVAFALLTVYLALRMVATGHGPFSNQHEFSVSFSWGIFLALIVFVWRYQLRMLNLVVLPVVTLMLIYSTQLDTEVKPLVPALQNNLLLTFHVGFAVIAYGTACVSFGAAVLYLIAPAITSPRFPRRDLLDEVGYRAAALTFPLLTIMIILGSIWANVAWGRYWGWDPKETAAFVTWLIYGAFLHARVVGNWRGTRAAWILVIGFVAVLFAYFGNHFFGGLHSYA